MCVLCVKSLQGLLERVFSFPCFGGRRVRMVARALEECSARALAALGLAAAAISCSSYACSPKGILRAIMRLQARALRLRGCQRTAHRRHRRLATVADSPGLACCESPPPAASIVCKTRSKHAIQFAESSLAALESVGGRPPRKRGGSSSAFFWSVCARQKARSSTHALNTTSYKRV